MAFTYFVRKLGSEILVSSHDWHVQPVCQRPESDCRLSGSFSRLARQTGVLENCCLSCPLGHQRRTFQTYRESLLLVNAYGVIFLILHRSLVLNRLAPQIRTAFEPGRAAKPRRTAGKSIFQPK